jgi:heme-degrading monooxygenase HmoA
MFLFYSIHYPHPGKEELLAESMHLFGEEMKKQPGFIFVASYPFKDPEKGTLMGISFWESQAAFEAAAPALQKSRKINPSNELEIKPPDVYMLHSPK